MYVTGLLWSNCSFEVTSVGTSPGGWVGSGGRVHPGKSSQRSSVSSVSSQAKLSQSSSNSHSRLKEKQKCTHARLKITRTVLKWHLHYGYHIWNHLQLIQHPLHLLIDLIGWRTQVLFLFNHTSVTFRGADRFVTLAPVKRQRGLFTPEVQRWLVVGNLRWHFRDWS